jgi:hypothetical protein
MTRWWTILMTMVGLLPGLTVCASYQDAVVAHQLLADFAESVVVRGVAGTGDNQVREEHFVFFKCEGVLWCYSPAVGTRVYGPAPAEWPPPNKQVLAWLQQTDPAFSVASVYRGAHTVAVNQTELPNGCVISCFAQITKLLVTTGTPDEAGLVLFSYGRRLDLGEGLVSGVIDHSILVYRYREQWYCLDPRLQDTPLPLRQVAVGTHLDPPLRILAERPDYRLEHARLLLISARTLDQAAANRAWRTWAKQKD